MITSQEVFDRVEDYGILDFYSIKTNYSRNVLEVFSKCKITKEDDRLPAISGVVKKFEEMLRDRYLAGLWLGQLHTELLWRTRTRARNRPPRRTSSYVAPSWSWASLNAEIFLFDSIRDRTDVYFAEILQANVEPVGDDHTGQLRGGFIRLIGALQHVMVSKAPTPEELPLLAFCNLVERNLQSESVSRNGTGQDIIYGHIDVDDMAGVNEQFLFLPLLSTYGDCHGILVRETADAGIFTRVGMARTRDTPDSRYDYISDSPNWQKNVAKMRIDYYARKKEAYENQDCTKKGPHNLFLGEPEVPPQGLVRLVPQEITII
ncbi:hypothetical protein HYALB_00002489 [Hymenoscyphus albidus]|uniref:Uncharacterized protein n=1 Tax=Hymenoscyphus albidus TaxID=595503 RepID=A0A9N9PYE3_9HELO|nr:hypothetical protein HYALB_00002489 [Hymenoscyphus albidus]